MHQEGGKTQKISKQLFARIKGFTQIKIYPKEQEAAKRQLVKLSSASHKINTVNDVEMKGDELAGIPKFAKDGKPKYNVDD